MYEYKNHYLFFQAVCSPLTIYKDINKLEPGKGIQKNSQGTKVFTHYDIRYKPDNNLSENDWITRIRNEIQKAIQVFVPMVEAAGLRVRYPLLDRDLVDFTCTIPPALKVKWKKNRYIFKEAMKGFLPDEIITKSKHGMGLPVTPWFKQERQMKALLYDILFSGTPAMTRYIKPEFIQKMKTAFETDASTYYGDNLWVFLILEMWLNQGR